MKYLLRPYRNTGIFGFVALAALGLGLAATLPAQAPIRARIIPGSFPLLEHANEPGYLGVEIVDVDADRAQTLKLKDAHGAVVTLVDHDAPAGQIGLRVNDVVLGLNGQAVSGADELRKILKEIPPGRKVSIEISRDGNVQTMAVSLADRKAMEHDIWGKIGPNGDPGPQPPPPGMGILAGGGDSPIPGGFHMPFFSGSLKVGAMVEPLTSQMADYLGIKSGLMVKQVERKSEAETAGLRAFDVILKVGSDSIATAADWDRALRSNAGKPVQVTILRDKKQETVTLQVDSKRRSAVDRDEFFELGDEPMMAELEQYFGPEFAQDFSAPDRVQAEAVRQQADQIRESLRDLKLLDSQQMNELHKQIDQLRGSFSPGDFSLDWRQMNELHRQLDELNPQIEEFRDQAHNHFD